MTLPVCGSPSPDGGLERPQLVESLPENPTLIFFKVGQLRLSKRIYSRSYCTSATTLSFTRKVK